MLFMESKFLPLFCLFELKFYSPVNTVKRYPIYEGILHQRSKLFFLSGLPLESEANTCNFSALSDVCPFKLMLSMLSKNFSRLSYFFSPRKKVDISCKMSPHETICMKCQSLFAEFVQSVYSKTCVRQPPSRLTLNGKNCLSYKGTCHVILLAKLQTCTFIRQLPSHINQ